MSSHRRRPEQLTPARQAGLLEIVRVDQGIRPEAGPVGKDIVRSFAPGVAPDLVRSAPGPPAAAGRSGRASRTSHRSGRDPIASPTEDFCRPRGRRCSRSRSPCRTPRGARSAACPAWDRASPELSEEPALGVDAQLGAPRRQLPALGEVDQRRLCRLELAPAASQRNSPRRVTRASARRAVSLARVSVEPAIASSADRWTVLSPTFTSALRCSCPAATQSDRAVPEARFPRHRPVIGTGGVFVTAPRWSPPP